MNDLYVGVEIGGTKLQVVASQCLPKIADHYCAPVDVTLGAQGILDEIKKALSELLGHRLPTAIGVGFGGPVDRRTGQIACSHQIAGWEHFPLGRWFKDQWNTRASIDNDANVAGLAEAVFGAGTGFDPVFYVTLGSGVGGGLVVNGHIYHGETPGEAEIGHLRLNRDGLILEHSCSGWAVNRKVRSAIKEEPDTELALLAKEHPGVEAIALSPAVAAQDSFALQILRSTADDLAFGLSHVIHLQHPQTVILGGGLSRLGEPLRKAVADALPQYLMEIMPPPIIKLSQLGENAVPTGALALAKLAAPGPDHLATAIPDVPK
ncbi:MAG: putative fructokinase [Verrucomicrobia subdivision 3 bacterium]|nr:putative fructokinase [Limisphaerales bacterium]MCS1415868.1 putative fructokinase [Limisphaerales bacterium]